MVEVRHRLLALEKELLDAVKISFGELTAA
jgi:hypothetical protein